MNMVGIIECPKKITMFRRRRGRIPIPEPLPWDCERCEESNRDCPPEIRKEHVKFVKDIKEVDLMNTSTDITLTGQRIEDFVKSHLDGHVTDDEGENDDGEDDQNDYDEDDEQNDDEVNPDNEEEGLEEEEFEPAPAKKKKKSNRIYNLSISTLSLIYIVHHKG